MRIELVRQNEHRIAVSEEQAKKYRSKGFKVVGEMPAKEINTDDVVLTELSLPELKELAKSKGITGYSALKKDDLVKVLEGDANDKNDKSRKTGTSD